MPLIKPADTGSKTKTITFYGNHMIELTQRLKEQDKKRVDRHASK